MKLNPANSTAQVVTVFCALSCIYLPIYLLYLFYSDNIYEIGKFYSLTLILIICSAELIKFSISSLLIDNSFGYKDSKTTKLKKYYLKFKLKEIFKCVYVLFCSTAVFYILAVFFGAPVLSECEKTLMYALLLSTLTMFPSCLHLGADNTIALVTGSHQTANTMADLMLQNIRCTLLSAWVSAVVIPLDWDRPWQMWPIPCCTGAMLGYIASHVLVLVKSIPIPNFITRNSVKSNI